MSTKIERIGDQTKDIIDPAVGIVLTADTPIHPADDLANDIDD